MYKTVKSQSVSKIKKYILMNDERDNEIQPKEENLDINSQIERIINSWNNADIDELYRELVYFINTLNIFKELDKSYNIIPIVDIACTVIVSPFNDDNNDQIIFPNYIIKACLKVIVNLSCFDNSLNFLPQTICDLSCNIFNICTSSDSELNHLYLGNVLKILCNLTAKYESCCIIKKELTFNSLVSLYSSSKTSHLKKEKCLMILYNIIKYSDISNSTFPLDNILRFIKDIINNGIHLVWILDLIKLLMKNDFIAFQIMNDKELCKFIQNCLDRNFILGCYKDLDHITKVQVFALNILFGILYIENYNFENFDIIKVLQLANSRDSFDVLTAVFNTLQNFIDCPEHAEILVKNDVLDIVSEQLRFGDYEIKNTSGYILSNLLIFSPESIYDQIIVENTFEMIIQVLNETDDKQLILNTLRGLYEVFSKIEKESLPIHFRKLFLEYDGPNAVDSLENNFEEIDDSTKLYIEKLKQFFKGDPNL